MDKLLNINPIILALIATMLTYFMNLLGSCTVLLFKNVSKKLLDCFLAFGAGIMISASFFSLLNPAIDKANELNMISWIVISIGFLFGGLLIILADIFLNKMIANKNIKANKRSILMFSAITLHNIPEGIAVGVAFGSVLYNLDGQEYSDHHDNGCQYLESFEYGYIPTFTYVVDGVKIIKKIAPYYGHNCVAITYKILNPLKKSVYLF